MMVVALIMRPWVLMARAMGARPKVLADDVLMVVNGRRMLEKFAAVLNATRGYLQAMGAKVAPTKSFNFASSKSSRDWLADTWWAEIGAHIEVVKDFRYLGAHFCSAGARGYRTLEKRVEEAVHKMRRLQHVPGSTETRPRS